MAIIKETKLGYVKVVSDFKHVEVKMLNLIKEDGVIISSIPHMKVLECGRVDADENFIDTDISGEHADVQSICNAAWTQEVKDIWKARTIEEKAMIEATRVEQEETNND
tara:strand:- start:59 stop:385 length:327 start_codon:yes stop_codon:yes gene_type:complete